MADTTTDPQTIRAYLTLIPFARLESGVVMANGIGTTVADSFRAAKADLDRLAAQNGGYARPPEGEAPRAIANVCPLPDGFDNWHWDGNKAVVRKSGPDGTFADETPLSITVAFSFDPLADINGPIRINGLAA